MIETADKPLDDREVRSYFDFAGHDGGQWHMAISLVKKYGVVPSYVMPESFNTSATNGLASALADKERKDALALRRLAQAGDQEGLEKARKALNGRFAAELYGEGEMTLVHAAVQALETHHRLLVCCDADAGTLLEARMETVAGAEKVFDFGAMSYADAKVREKLSAKVCRVKGGPVPAKLTRVRAAQRLVGADFAAGCLERAQNTVLFLGSRKGCWVRTVANTDAPALWLLDMIRRAASGLPQAAGTSWQKYGRAIPADALTAQRLPDKPEPDAPIAAPRKRHRVRNALIFLLILLILLIYHQIPFPSSSQVSPDRDLYRKRSIAR